MSVQSSLPATEIYESLQLSGSDVDVVSMGFEAANKVPNNKNAQSMQRLNVPDPISTNPLHIIQNHSSPSLEPNLAAQGTNNLEDATVEPSPKVTPHPVPTTARKRALSSCSSEVVDRHEEGAIGGSTLHALKVDTPVEDEDKPNPKRWGLPVYSGESFQPLYSTKEEWIDLTKSSRNNLPKHTRFWVINPDGSVTGRPPTDKSAISERTVLRMSHTILRQLFNAKLPTNDAFVECEVVYEKPGAGRVTWPAKLRVTNREKTHNRLVDCPGFLAELKANNATWATLKSVQKRVKGDKIQIQLLEMHKRGPFSSASSADDDGQEEDGGGGAQAARGRAVPSHEPQKEDKSKFKVDPKQPSSIPTEDGQASVEVDARPAIPMHVANNAAAPNITSVPGDKINAKRRKTTDNHGSQPVRTTVQTPEAPSHRQHQQQQQQQRSKGVAELLDYITSTFSLSFKELICLEEMLEWMKATEKLVVFESYVRSGQANTSEVVKDAVHHYMATIKSK